MTWFFRSEADPLPIYLASFRRGPLDFTHETGHAQMLHYIDDYLIMTVSDMPYMQSFVKFFKLTCRDLGVPLALQKTKVPATTLTFLGIQLDAVSQTLSLPSAKQQLFLLLLQIGVAELCPHYVNFEGWRTHQFAAKCVPAGTFFIRRIIDLLKGRTDSKQIIQLHDDFEDDLD